MAVSNSFDFTLNRDEFIKKALLMLGVVSPSQTPTALEISDASKSLNLLLKSLQADGLNLWQIREVSVTPVAARKTYTMGASGHINTGGVPTDVVSVHRRNTASNTDIPLEKISREEYWRIPDKTSAGTPVSYYYDPQLGASKLSLWPVPDSTFAGANTLEISYSKAVDDVESAAQTLSVPQEWELSILYGLAVVLAPEYGIPLSERRLLRQEYDVEKERVLDWDTEHSSAFFRVGA